jgi:enediyne biosynthesis protein E4
MKKKVLCMFGLLIAVLANSQPVFEKVTNPLNAASSIPPLFFYNGIAWIDYDKDGKQDFFIVQNGLYHNDGNGLFTKILNSGLPATGGIGTTWADYNNDGYIDCLISGGGAVGTRLYKNNGNGTFSQITDTVLQPIQLRGWGSAFGDVNNDGWVDIAIASPIGFAGITDPGKFLLNKKNGSFEKITGLVFTDVLDAYTVPSWSDYDNDGDVDLFIGSGRVNGGLSPDYNFINKTRKGGLPVLKRIINGPLGTETGHDGQIWNWIDFDNDGDLDAYLTNYSGLDPVNGTANEFYRNDNGTLVKLTEAVAGTIVTDIGFGLASTWGDFDNDGDLDCITTSNSGVNHYYQNNFTNKHNNNQFPYFSSVVDSMPFLGNSGSFSFTAASADYDDDGDLDILMSAGTRNRGLYTNKLIDSNNRNWVKIKLAGTISNKSALGAKVRVRAHTQNGKPVWQMREVSSQNTFNGMNMLDLHFGLGSAKKIDDIIIEWPSGRTDSYKNLNPNQTYNYIEGKECDEDEDEEQRLASASFTSKNIAPESIEKNEASLSFSIFPNPFISTTNISYKLEKGSNVSLKIYDAAGKLIKVLVNGQQKSGSYNHSLSFSDISSGNIYLAVLQIDEKRYSKKVVLQR